MQTARKYPNPRVRKVKSIQEALGRFFSKHKGRENFQIVHLWENWDMVMGETLKDLALPLGCKERILRIGAEDNMLLYELGFYAQEILARANAFMHEEYFTKIRFELLQNRKPLAPKLDTTGPIILPEERQRPDQLGGLLRYFDPESKIGKAYRSYVESFKAD